MQDAFVYEQSFSSIETGLDVNSGDIMKLNRSMENTHVLENDSVFEQTFIPIEPGFDVNPGNIMKKWIQENYSHANKCFRIRAILYFN